MVLRLLRRFAVRAAVRRDRRPTPAWAQPATWIIFVMLAGVGAGQFASLHTRMMVSLVSMSQ